MRSTVAALVAAGLASPSPAQPRVDPGSYRTVAMRPVKLADAMREFERICLATGFDHGRFGDAVARSKWRFRVQPGAGTPAPDVRQALQAMVGFHGPPSQQEQDFVPAQCNMEAMLRPHRDEAAVPRAFEAALGRLLGAAPPRFDFPGESCWRWKPSPELVHRLCLIDRAGLAPGHSAWSFQRWTAAGEARARLVPPARP